MSAKAELRRRIVLISATLGAVPGLALATTYNWNGGFGNWNSGGNWIPFGIPRVGDIANVTNTLGAAQTVTYNYTGTAVALNTLTIDLSGNTGAGSETLAISTNDALTAGIENVGYSGVEGNGSGTLSQSSGRTLSVRCTWARMVRMSGFII